MRTTFDCYNNTNTQIWFTTPRNQQKNQAELEGHWDGTPSYSNLECHLKKRTFDQLYYQL